ncbi:disintegrin and metalloproteinase domain-containing protein 10-like isoform X2 [Centruroides sculpturatus]|uniref:disintegrin and metalloproteinase domain-containing protein 10-like isoform X2 n=1 Tax=Centruroides sculpturatus TaxID=218467 RepID=UPI000C6EAE00|nr:disintegrin and metalloproteinase domain-containing protein 10-like isoform X2 [Centruroides sculpturatus]
MNSLTISLNIYVSFFLFPTSINYQKLQQFRHYDIIDFKAKFNKDKIAEHIRRKLPITLKFRAFEKNFELILQEDNSVISPSAKVFIVGEEIIKLYPKNIEGSSIYKGIVSGEPQSVANGYLHRNGFIGKIQLKYNTFYTENAFTYFKDETFKDKLIIYKEVDITPVQCKRMKGYRACSKPKNKLYRNLSNHKETWKSDVRNSKFNKRNMLMCSIEIMADHTFVDYFNKDRGTIIAEMLYHIKVADKVLRNLDFSMVDAPERIKLNVEKITLIENRNNPSYYLNESIDNSFSYTVLLSAYSKQAWCMFISFCHRDFNDTIGLSYTGGVCLGHIQGVSENVAFITNVANKRRVPRTLISKILLQTMGYLFGSTHDPPNDPVCSPANLNNTLGNYIMYIQSAFDHSDESLYNNWKFSPCSKSRIYEHLFVNKGAYCMTKPKSTCGNGITEQGEECDCGSKESCEKLDPCCNPPGSGAPCALRKRSKNFCSPREGDCCNEKCEFLAKEEQRQCFVFTPCREKILQCNGLTPFCPEVISPDGSPCLGPNKCKSGRCLIDICKRNDLEICKCPDNLECQICCKDQKGNCKSASDWKIRLPDKEIFETYLGTPCNNNSGKCLMNGTCNVIHIRGNWWNTFWPFLLPIPIYTIIRLFVLLYRYCEKNIILYQT